MAGILSRVCPKVFRQIKTPGFAGAHMNALMKIGNREIVGYGFNGQPSYADRLDFPFPAIRWRETTPEYCALQEKEKGDWRALTVEEKKLLYRSTFRQTFAEMKAPTGEWKSVIGLGCMYLCLAFFSFYSMVLYLYDPRPQSFSPESQRAQLRRMIDLKLGHITGVSSKWDYEKDDWKK